MVRKIMLLAVAAAVAFAALPVAAARPVPVNAAFQEEQDEPVAPPEIQSLALGERFVGDAFALEVQDVLIVPSVLRTDFNDIRVAVAFQNRGDEPLPFSPVALSGEPGYPSLQLVDDEGVIQQLDRSDPYRMAVAASNLSSIPAGIPAHWTLGFEASSEQSSDLTMQAVWDGFVVAEWDLLSTPRPLQGWDAPAGAVEAGLGDAITWDDALTLRLARKGTVACGLADLVHSATSSEVVFEVDNSDVIERPFPAVQYPDVPMIAVWRDGTSSKHSFSVGLVDQGTSDIVNFSAFASRLNELEEDLIRLEVMNQRPGPEFNLVPPQVRNASISSLFVAARDSRLADVLEPPAAVYMLPTDADPVWLDLTEAVNFTDTPEEAKNPSCGIATPSVELGTREPQRKLLDLRVPAEEVTEDTGDTISGSGGT